MTVGLCELPQLPQLPLPSGPKLTLQTGYRRPDQRPGAGLIADAADDDPGGIVTDSQAGSQFGHAMLRAVMFASACGAIAVDGLEYPSLDQTEKGIRLHSQLVG